MIHATLKQGKNKVHIWRKWCNADNKFNYYLFMFSAGMYGGEVWNESYRQKETITSSKAAKDTGRAWLRQATY